MVLTASEIKRQKKLGKIHIQPFNESQLNPNSYNLCLSPNAILFDKQHPPLDMKQPALGREVVLLEEGYVLYPGELLLGSTVEYTKSFDLVPRIEGRSSHARLGLSAHVSAGYGDIGYCGTWTLEMTCVLPIKIYPFVEICQMEWASPVGEIDQTYNGKYQDARSALPSRLSKEFE